MSKGAPSSTNTKRLLSWVALLMGVLLLVASAAEWIHRGRQVPEEVVKAEIPSASPPPKPAPIHTTWPSLLTGPTCDSPCCGGEKCGVDAANGRDYIQFCRPGMKTCLPCASGLSCIPGGCELELAKGEAWQLRVSAVRGGSPPKSVCEQADADMRVCVVKTGGVRTCWTNEDVCNARGPTLPVTTDELMGPGVDVEIQDATGKVVSKTHRTYAEGMRRRGLCTGYVVRGFKPQVFYGEVQFFLAP